MKVLAFLEAFLVVLLWSASPPLVKMALEDLSPLQIAGLRYFAAFVLLVPLLLMRSLRELRNLERAEWARLILMGVLAYPIGNGLLFWGLETLPSTTSSFLLNCIPLYTLILGMVWLKESPNRLQWIGAMIAVVGALVFFGLGLQFTEAMAVGATLVGGLAMAIFSVMSRDLIRRGKAGSVVITAVPQGVGGGLLLLVAPVRAVPPMRTVAILAWLAVFNSALGYILWNHAMKRLKAFEIGFVGNLMPMGTALLAPLMLSESVPARAWLGIAIALAGVVLVSLGGERAGGPAVGGAEPAARA
ncbi:MAG: DMT family transporter [Anaerolineales bacterium]